MSNWKDNIRIVDPYTPGEQPKDKNIIKLNTNENPYPPSPLVEMTIKNFSEDLNRRYPDATADKLISNLAKYHGCDKNQVFAGVGSDDVLGMLFLTFFNSDKPILFPDITYSFYPVWAELFKIPYQTIPLNSSFEINISDYNIPNGGIVIANPNAPTGIYLDKSSVEEIISSNPDSIVIVDEAYIDFAPEGSSCIDLIDKYDNLVVVRTFSKSRSLAGLRVGYALSNPEVIKYLNDVKYSYNSYTLNSLAIEAGSVSIDDEAYFRKTIADIVNTRERFAKELENIGFDVLKSSTNFLFAGNKNINTEDLFNYLKANNIYVRYFKSPRIDNFLRITIGKEEEMERLIEKINEFLTQ